MKTIRQSCVSLHILSIALLFCSILFFASCEFHSGSSRQLKKEVDSFAVYYFNWQFHQARRFVTPSSEKWMRYAASQVHQADIELLQNKEVPATCEIHEITYSDDDSTAVAHVTIHDFLHMDTIGKAASIVNAAHFDIPLKYEAKTDKWIVEVDGLMREVRN